jgi:flagellar FliJ protein
MNFRGIMNGSKRLKPIKKLADNKEKVAAQTLGNSVEQRKLQLDKMNQLINYRVEYIESMTNKGQQGISGDQLHQYYAFLTKLDTAIAHQKQVVEQSEITVSRNQSTWKSDNSRANVLSKVIKTMKGKEEKEINNKENSHLDEMSTQAFLRRKR